MTIAEYREQVFASVRSAADESAAKAVIGDAQKVLETSGIASHTKREFWVDLYRLLDGEADQQANFSKRAAEKGPKYLSEAQSAEALSEIVAAAKEAVGQLVGR